MPKPPKARERRAKSRGSERETEILEAYLEVAMKEGVESVTLQKVAAHASVAYSTVHYYFGMSESSLLDQALNYVAKASESFMESQMALVNIEPERNALHEYINAKIAWIRKFPSYASMFYYFIYYATRDLNTTKRCTALYLETQKKIQMLLFQEIGKGTYPPLRNMDALAKSIASILRGEQMAYATSEPKNEHIENSIQNLIEMVIKQHIVHP